MGIDVFYTQKTGWVVQVFDQYNDIVDEYQFDNKDWMLYYTIKELINDYHISNDNIYMLGRI